MAFFSPDLWHSIFLYIPALELSVTSVLSNRRNKGQLSVCARSSVVVRDLNLEFYNSGTNDGLSSSLVREVSLLRRRLAGHPNIVPLISVIVPDRRPIGNIKLVYPQYKYSLREFLKSDGIREKSPPLLFVREVAYQLLRGVAFMHKQGVVHRNLKPENVFLKHWPVMPVTVLIGDFCCAKSTSSQGLFSVNDCRQPSTPEDSKNRPQTERERARLMYRPPELLLRLHSYSELGVDVWALGVIIFELLLFPIVVPWSAATSELETVMRVFKCFGTPDELGLGVGLSSFPKFVKSSLQPENPEPFIVTERGPNGDPFIEHANPLQYLVSARGIAASAFISRVLNPDPLRRVSAEWGLRSAFVLGSEEGDGNSDFSTESINDAGEEISICPVPTPAQSLSPEWIAWLFKVAKIVDCSTSRPVHVAVRMWGNLIAAVPSFSLPIGPVLIACLKTASRFFTSRDMYKQLSLEDVFATTSIRPEQVVEAELWLLQKDILPDVADEDKVIEWSSELLRRRSKARNNPFPETERICYATQFIQDLCLLGDLYRELPPCVIKAAAAILAVQLEESAAISVRINPEIVTVDEVQLALSRILSVLGSYQLDPEVKLVLELMYRCSEPALVKTNFAQYFNTSRGPPPAPLIRASTLEHVTAWMLETRRKSKKRRRSSCKPVVHQEETKTPVRTGKGFAHRSLISTTPRRSQRLMKKY